MGTTQSLLQEKPISRKPAASKRAKLDKEDINGWIGVMLMSIYLASSLENAMNKTLSPALKTFDDYFKLWMRDK